ncbi:MAG: hypothetical protein QM784_36600 [Polyangiaceae bacterium]
MTTTVMVSTRVNPRLRLGDVRAIDVALKQEECHPMATRLLDAKLRCMQLPPLAFHLKKPCAPCSSQQRSARATHIQCRCRDGNRPSNGPAPDACGDIFGHRRAPKRRRPSPRRQPAVDEPVRADAEVRPPTRAPMVRAVMTQRELTTVRAVMTQRELTTVRAVMTRRERVALLGYSTRCKNRNGGRQCSWMSAQARRVAPHITSQANGARRKTQWVFCLQ